MRETLLAAIVLLSCGCERTAPRNADAAAGRAMEAAARGAGLIDTARGASGVYASGDDRICVMQRATGARFRIGVSVDYGDGQRCVGRGTAVGREDLALDLGGDCRFHATHDGERLTFPAHVPAACARQCQGRATFDALSVERLSEAAGEAERLRGADGGLLCTD